MTTTPQGTPGAGATTAPAPGPARRFTRRQRSQMTQGVLYLVLVGFVLWLVTSADWAAIRTEFLDAETWRSLWPDIVTVGAVNTIKYTVLAFGGGLMLAIVLALMRLSPVAPYRWIATAFIEFFRGLPALVVILFMALGLPLALGWSFPEITWLNMGSTTSAAVFALVLVGSAYMAETLRAGLQAVPKGQAEAARSLGMSKTRTLITIQLPQAIRIVVPPLTNEFVLLVKDTSLISIAGMQAIERDLTAFGQNGMTTYMNASPLLAIAVMYLLISLPITRLVAWMEKRQQRAR